VETERHEVRDDACAYDRIGVGYATRRRDEPRFAEAILHALGDAWRVLNVGAGTGSYEPPDRQVIALEPSEVMIRQRAGSRYPVVQGIAESMPFPSRSFDAALAVLTVHHWSNRAAGLAELCRVSRRRVVVSFDPEVHNRLWLMDYIPELARLESLRAPSIGELVEKINGTVVTMLPVPCDCVDGMTVAFWQRPAAYLDPEVRLGSSCLRQAEPHAVQRGLRKLEADLQSGTWQKRYGHLLELSELDCGIRLIVGEEDH
jgi:SAM-dependent methyltransferase